MYLSTIFQFWIAPALSEIVSFKPPRGRLGFIGAPQNREKWGISRCTRAHALESNFQISTTGPANRRAAAFFRQVQVPKLHSQMTISE